MGNNYSDSEIKEFQQKDLRIVRQNALAHATKMMVSRGFNGDEAEYMDQLFQIASSCVSFVYEGMQFPLEKPAPQGRNPVVVAVANQLGIPTTMLQSLEEEILNIYGKLPTNMKSVDKICETINKENITND